MKKRFLKISKVNEHLRVCNVMGKLIAIIDLFDISFQCSVTLEELSTIQHIAENYELWFSNLQEMEVKNV